MIAFSVYYPVTTQLLKVVHGAYYLRCGRLVELHKAQFYLHKKWQSRE